MGGPARRDLRVASGDFARFHSIASPIRCLEFCRVKSTPSETRNDAGSSEEHILLWWVRGRRGFRRSCHAPLRYRRRPISRVTNLWTDVISESLAVGTVGEAAGGWRLEPPTSGQSLRRAVLDLVYLLGTEIGGGQVCERDSS